MQKSSSIACLSFASMWAIVALFISLCVLLQQTHAFFHGLPAIKSRQGGLSMMFGGGSKKAAAVIKVDGKTIIPSAPLCNLRKELQANGVEVYPLRARITGNCGGAGICGTCAVKVLDGAANLSPMSKNEANTLQGKPADYRLSCCARVSGPISIKTKP